MSSAAVSLTIDWGSLHPQDSPASQILGLRGPKLTGLRERWSASFW
jgi:hypothetical protein